jgi:DNA-binding response OmpR family regulator
MQAGARIAGRLLLVEDDRRLARSLARGLREAGLATDVVHDGQSALEAASAAYDLVILDVQLPGLDGFEVCRRLRHRRGFAARVLMLTARDAGQDRLLGSAAGADAYMVKPFPLDELVARVRSLLRPGESGRGPLVAGPLTLRSDSRVVRVSGRRLDLTGKEFQVLEFFMLHPGRPIQLGRILNSVWSSDFEGGRGLVDVYVRRLRRKLGDAGLADPFVPVRRAGYRFAPPGIPSSCD